MDSFLLGLFVTTTMALASYFFNKWLGEIEEKITTLRADVRGLRDSHVELLKEIKSTKTQISTELKELPQIQALAAKIESLDRVKEYLKQDFLPRIQENQEHYGKIIHLEARTQDFENRLLKMFKAVELLVTRSQSQKP